MKSGPHLKGCTASRRFRSAAITASVTVVFPTPLAGPAMTKPLLRPRPRIAPSFAILLSPMLEENQLLQRYSRQPSRDFQFRPRQKLAHIAETQISNRNDVLRNSQHAVELCRIENAHPAHEIGRAHV